MKMQTVLFYGKYFNINFFLKKKTFRIKIAENMQESLLIPVDSTEQRKLLAYLNNKKKKICEKNKIKKIRSRLN